MQVVVVGLNHKTAPVEVRERLSFTSNRLPEALAAISALSEVSECVILSTCNRTEIYVSGRRYHSMGKAIYDFLARFHGLDKGLFRDHLYFLNGEEAIEHLFRVASGLDSMVLGETQILHQVKDAYNLAVDCGTVSKVLHTLFEQALKVGKRARTQTEISQNAVSVSYAAVEMVKKVFSSLEGKKVLIVGAGKMSELTATHLVEAGVREVYVANRTFERAVELSGKFNGQPVAFSEITGHLSRMDVVISSTGAPHLVITRAMVAQALKARRGRPIFFIDIAVPRDIEPSIAQLNGVFLYDIDDLQSVVEANLSRRQKEARKVEGIIREEVEAFLTWQKNQEVVPLIRSLRGKAEEIVEHELSRAFNKLPDLTDREREIVESLVRRTVNKLLNDPTLRLKELSRWSDREQYVSVVRALFNLAEEQESADRGDAKSELG